MSIFSIKNHFIKIVIIISIINTLLALDDLVIHYGLYPIPNMMNKYEELMELKTNFFSVTFYSKILHGAK